MSKSNHNLREGDIVHVEGKSYPFIVSCVENGFTFITGLGESPEEQDTMILSYSNGGCFGHTGYLLNMKYAVYRVDVHPEYEEHKRAIYEANKAQMVERLLDESLIVKHGLVSREDLREILNGKPYIVDGFKVTVRAFGADLDDYPILVTYEHTGGSVSFYEWMAVDLFRFAQKWEIIGEGDADPTPDDMDFVDLHDLINAIVCTKEETSPKSNVLTALALYPDENGDMWLVDGQPNDFHATNIKTRETRLFEDDHGLLTTGNQLKLDERQLAKVQYESIEDITLRKGDVVQVIEDNQVYNSVVVDDNYNDVTPILVVYGYGGCAAYTAEGYDSYFKRRRAITGRLGHFEYFDSI